MGQAFEGDNIHVVVHLLSLIVSATSIISDVFTQTVLDPNVMQLAMCSSVTIWRGKSCKLVIVLCVFYMGGQSMKQVPALFYTEQ